jgi:tRNA A-37 threonylcarbamoyl transferase component Bud32
MSLVEQDHQLDRLLGADLAALVRARGAPLAAATEITGLPSPVRTRAAFRLEFADGTRLKGRRLKSAERAEVVHRLQDVVGDGLPRILDRRGEALLLEWVAGRPLASFEVVPADILQRCGRMLGELHRAFAGYADGGVVPGPDHFCDRLERDVALLLGAGWIDASFARRAVDVAVAHRPREARTGIIHKDFCAANVVIRSDGVPVCVDNANLAVGPHDLDLARTWYRWSMTSAERRHFAAGYEEHARLASCLRHFPFWATCVLVGSASIRLRSQTPGGIEALDRLGSVLERTQRGAGGADHPFWVG